MTRLLAEKHTNGNNNDEYQQQREEEAVFPQVLDLVVENKTLPTGINATLFNNTMPSLSTEYSDLVTILRNPSIRRLDLPLLVAGQQRTGWPALRSGLLYDALAHATHSFEEIHLCAADVVEQDPDFGGLLSYDGERRHFTPLRSIFPITDNNNEQWSRLRHFRLSGFYVRQDDLIDLLITLMTPSRTSLRSVELSFLSFLPCVLCKAWYGS